MTDSFWDLIGDNRIPMQTEGDIESAIERVALRLQDLNPVELTQFQDELHRHLFELDREELASISVMLRDGTLQPQSSDGFLFKRAACVLAGKHAFEASTSSLADFVRFVEPFANAAESLLYLAPNEYLRKTGSAGVTSEGGRDDAVQITTTADHPYWNATSGTYQELQRFSIGDRVSTRGQTLVYAGIGSNGANAVAFNLTVAGPHTYLVGEAWTLVHNCGDGDAAGVPEGVVYSRKDLLGGSSYVGQAKNESRYLSRQAEHARANPDADFEFDILGRENPGKSLDRMEDHFIRQGGGPTNKGNPNGGLANRRHQMNDTRYREAGGDL